MRRVSWRTPIPPTPCSTTNARLRALPDTATILGYHCQAMEIVEDGVSTTYFYAPALTVDPDSYSRHQLRQWYGYMRLTQGALTLRYVIRFPDQPFVMYSEAISVKPMKFREADFTPSSVAR